MNTRAAPPLALWIATAALHAALLILYARGLDHRPSSLDDVSHLMVAAQQGAGDVLRADRYGHVRPLKSALFWLLARDEALFPVARGAVLGLLLATALLVQRLAARLSGSSATGLLAAACWSIHPMIASVTCWMSAASTALGAALVLLFLEHGWLAITAQLAGHARAARALLAVSWLELALALLAHELAVVAPVLLGLRIALFSKERGRFARILLGASCAIVAVWLAVATSLAGLRVQYRFAEQPAWALAVSSARYIFQHALMWLAPSGRFGVLLGDRPLEQLGVSALAWLALAALILLAWRRRASDPVLSFAFAWFLVTMAPVANLVPLGNTPIAMHYLYVPSMGLALIVARASALFAARLRPDHAGALQLALPVALTVWWVPETARSISAWGDDAVLFERTAANYPREVEPLVNLASRQLERQDYREAEATLARARVLAPEDIGVVRNSFSLLWQTQRFEAALAVLDRHPTVAARPEFQLGRGQALVRLGRMAEAIEPLERALAAQSAEINEDLRVGGGLQLSLALAQTGRVADARRVVDRMLEQYPHRPELRSAAQLLRR